MQGRQGGVWERRYYARIAERSFERRGIKQEEMGMAAGTGFQRVCWKKQSLRLNMRQ